MTERAAADDADWLPLVRDVAQRSAHQLRNALNGLLVNLEVVRSRSGAENNNDPVAAIFVAQAVQQAEESAKLAEASIAMLDVVLGSVAGQGRLQCELISASSVRFDTGGQDADRHITRLQALRGPNGFESEADGSTVIFTVPTSSSADPN